MFARYGEFFVHQLQLYRDFEDVANLFVTARTLAIILTYRNLAGFFLRLVLHPAVLEGQNRVSDIVCWTGHGTDSLTPFHSSDQPACLQGQNRISDIASIALSIECNCTNSRFVFARSQSFNDQLRFSAASLTHCPCPVCTAAKL